MNHYEHGNASHAQLVVYILRSSTADIIDKLIRTHPDLDELDKRLEEFYILPAEPNTPDKRWKVS